MNRVVDSDRYLGGGSVSRVAGGNGGGNVDDILKRLGAVEVGVSDLRVQVGAIVAVLPHLATKEDIQGTKVDIQGTRVEIQGTRTEIQGVRVEIQSVRADMHAMEARIIKWMIGTSIASAAVASTIASVVAKFAS